MSELHLTQIASNVPGSEGPCYDRTGRWFCVAPDNGSILQILPDGTTREHANTGGIPAGLQCDTQNFLWCADMKLGILRISPEGKVEHVVKEYQGKPIRGCNDCALDARGNLYFTAPAGSGPEKPEGEVFVRKADGSVHRIDGGFKFCNGLAVNAAEDRLVVAETYTKKLWAYDLSPAADASGKRPFALMPGDQHGGPDGIDYDAEGNLLATHWGSSRLELYAPDGKLLRNVELPFEKPSNVHFGGPDGRTLVITEHTHNGVWKGAWHCPGLIR
jgi:sugar lactone lactonase YvrE